MSVDELSDTDSDPSSEESDPESLSPSPSPRNNNNNGHRERSDIYDSEDDESDDSSTDGGGEEVFRNPRYQNTHAQSDKDDDDDEDDDNDFQHLHNNNNNNPPPELIRETTEVIGGGNGTPPMITEDHQQPTHLPPIAMAPPRWESYGKDKRSADSANRSDQEILRRSRMTRDHLLAHRNYQPPAELIKQKTTLTIFVYRNGDAHFPARRIVFDTNKTRSLSILMEMITNQIRPPFGAVRRMFDTQGVEIKRLDRLEDGKRYVAGPSGKKFDKVAYEDIVNYATKERSYVTPKFTPTLAKRSRVKNRAPGRAIADSSIKPITLLCLENRNKDGNPKKVVLNKRDMVSFSHVLDLVTKKLGITRLTGPCKRLINMRTGKPAHRLEELQDQNYYCAVDRLDAIQLPPFTVDETSNKLVPANSEKKSRVKNKPIMFDRPIESKLDVGERMLDKLKERGFTSDVGKVSLKPREGPKFTPGKYMHSGLRKTPVMSPEDARKRKSIYYPTGITITHRAYWEFLHYDIIDALTAEIVEQALKEHHEQTFKLLNDYVVSRVSSNNAKVVEKLPLPDGDVLLGTVFPGEQGDGTTTSPLGSPIPVQQDDEDIIEAAGSPQQEGEDDHYLVFIEPVLDYMMSQNSEDVFHDPQSQEAELLGQQFLTLSEIAIKGGLAEWEKSARGLVALVITLDQFPRSVYRGTADMYKGDLEAKAVLYRAVEETGIIRDVAPMHILFCCLALSHQEDIKSQKLAVKLWSNVASTFARTDPIQKFGKTFAANQKIISRFGRFPQRNQVLGRANTQEEVHFMETAEEQII